MIARWLYLRRWRKSLRVGDSVRYTKSGDFIYCIRLIEDNELTVWDDGALEYFSFPKTKAYPITQSNLKPSQLNGN